MPRGDPEPQERLLRAALELYLERGFEDVTVAEIAERAGLARRTFFRYFTDRREVLFAGSERLPAAVAAAAREAGAALPPFEVALRALADVGSRLAEHAPDAAGRRAVIAASPELRERERTKLAAVADVLAGALRERDVADPGATLLAQVGVAVLQAAFTRWVDGAGRVAFADCFAEAVAAVRSSFRAAGAVAPGP